LRDASSDPDVRRLLADPYSLSTDRSAEPDLGAQPDLPRGRGSDIAPELAELWTAGFLMAPSNTRVVRRSNALQDWAYGRRFRYSDRDQLSDLRGVLTPAAAMGDALLARFPKAGVTLDTTRLT
jgi:short subunit dehydrogenase-like uncharacterized protein